MVSDKPCVMTSHDDKYLSLLENVLTFSLWPEPPRPVWLTARRDVVARLAKFAARLLRKCGLTLCVEKEIDREVGREWPLLAHTMVGRKRMENIRELCGQVVADNIPGSFVECGVWRGGASLYARACLPIERQVVCCDSFKGLPYDSSEPEFSKFDFLRVSRKEVESNFKRYGLNENVHFVEGYFCDTLHTVEGPIAILRADGDMFSSTVQILAALYNKVSPGGYVIIDDFLLEPCRKAVEWYRTANCITDPLAQIDDISAYWKKS